MNGTQIESKPRALSPQKMMFQQPRAQLQKN